MGSFVALLKREWFEHWAGFVWGPAIILALLLLAGIVAMTVNDHVQTDLSQHDRAELHEKMSGLDEGNGLLEIATVLAFDVAGSTDAELEFRMSRLLDGLSQPFHLVFIAIAFFTLLACLYDERKDQSILFWKSMPVADWKTVASKLAFVVWVAPLVTIAAIVIAQLYTVTLSALYVEEGMGGRIWAASDLWARPFALLARYFLLSLWALPLCAWVMLVSASVTRMPAIWTIAVPWLLILLEKTLLGTAVTGRLMMDHFSLLASAPGHGGGIVDQFALLGELRLWVGMVVGLAFLAGAVYFRGRNNGL